jgi:hypothetical protein
MFIGVNEMRNPWQVGTESIDKVMGQKIKGKCKDRSKEKQPKNERLRKNNPQHNFVQQRMFKKGLVWILKNKTHSIRLGPK